MKETNFLKVNYLAFAPILINRCPSASLNQMLPFQALSGIAGFTEDRSKDHSSQLYWLLSIFSLSTAR